MKKSFLALACALLLGQVAFAQNSQEVTFVEDPSQGYLFNQFKDNWFITAEGGVNIQFSPGDVHRDLKDRFDYNGSIYVGKWFSPVVGLRLGANVLKIKGLSYEPDALGVQPGSAMPDGLYKQKFLQIGPSLDAMINITNWVCGYKPGRIYNLTGYAGFGAFFSYARDYNNNPEGSAYKYCHDNVLSVRAGVINSVNVSKAVQLSLDVRFTCMDAHRDRPTYTWNQTNFDLSASLGVTYLFPKRDWNGPVVPVCPPAEDCSAYKSALDAANARIADLEAQLQACLEAPREVEEVVIEPAAPLATIYFPINVYKLTKEDESVIEAVAEVMKANPETKYVVTGWADNYTGTDAINTNLRKNRAASVERELIKCGVPASQFTTTINAGNLVDMGEKFVALDRAATIQVAE